LFSPHPTLEPNLSPEFVERLTTQLGTSLSGRNDKLVTTVEDIFRYFYAVMHSPTYRRRYAVHLKLEFPRVPLTESLALFRALAALGGELVALHLLESSKLAKPITRFYGSDRQLLRIGEKSKTLASVKNGVGRVPINGTSGFADVPQAVWDFHIGSYQVCHKWLDDRRKAERSLSDEDLAHYQKIVTALHETIRLMAAVDAAIEQHGGWPGAFAAKP
jgi:predicted helicase